MQIPLQIAFRGMEPSAAIEARVRERAAKLERFHDRVTGCHVTIQAPHQHQHKGQLFEVRLRLHVPGGEIAIDREGSRNHAHEDVSVALRDAFDAAERRLEDHVRRHDHRKEPGEVPLHGKVVRIFPQDGYGFVETSDGLEVYFHENAVTERGFGKLEVGDEVRIVLAEGESAKGPQASTIRPIGKHHLAN